MEDAGVGLRQLKTCINPQQENKRLHRMKNNPTLSIVIPVYNEERRTSDLSWDRLYPVVAGVGRPFEIIFTDRRQP